MKINKLLILPILLVIVTLTFYAFAGNKKADITPGSGFAVVELFTSEGCSSCPPADELVARIQKEDNGKPVYILAFHVDYWDRLGWKDQFSSGAFSQRQRQYATWLKSSEVYTPQIVVNGKKEFVGSEEGTLRNAIQSALQKASPATLTLGDLAINQLHAKVHYQTEGIGSNTTLLLALIEKSAQSEVKAGENNGRTLSHVQIVRQLQSIPLKGTKSGTEDITLPGNIGLKNFEIIGFLQNTTNGEIIGAARAGMPSGVKVADEKTK